MRIFSKCQVLLFEIVKCVNITSNSYRLAPNENFYYSDNQWNYLKKNVA